MSYFGAFFDKQLSIELLNELRTELQLVEGFRILGDWVQFKLDGVVSAGISLDSHPARSIMKEGEIPGGVFHVSIVLSGGDIDGPLHVAGMWMNNQEIITLQQDLAVMEKLASIMQRFGTLKMLDIQ
jgi:hypothetical protein